MARSPDWEAIPMAQGGDAPVWPLPSVPPKFATWSLGGGRPYGCDEATCERWHAGIDLTGAPDGAVIIASEDALVVGIDRPWSEGSKAAFLRTDSGLFVVLGGFKAGSHKEYGVVTGGRVKKGDKLGRVLGSYGMIHLETYAAKTRAANSVWWKKEPPPDGLLNPTNYVERMVGARGSLLQTRQRHEALAALGFYQGDVAAAWGPASEAALRAAQQALHVTADGKWGPQTEDAIHKALGDKLGAPARGSEAPDETGTDNTTRVRWLGWAVIGTAAAASLAVGALLVRRARDEDDDEDAA